MMLHPAVIGDSNCLFRAVPWLVQWRGCSYELIRLLTAIEIIEYRHHYDTSDTKYCDRVQDVRPLHDSYDRLLMSVMKPGGFSELMILFVASAALGVSIDSYCPCENWWSCWWPVQRWVWVYTHTAPVRTDGPVCGQCSAGCEYTLILPLWELVSSQQTRWHIMWVAVVYHWDLPLHWPSCGRQWMEPTDATPTPGSDLITLSCYLMLASEGTRPPSSWHQTRWENRQGNPPTAFLTSGGGYADHHSYGRQSVDPTRLRTEEASMQRHRAWLAAEWEWPVSVAAVSVPYRNSALTKILKSTLGGNSKSVMVSWLS